jgi:hypothetical protein
MYQFGITNITKVNDIKVTCVTMQSKRIPDLNVCISIEGMLDAEVMEDVKAVAAGKLDDMLKKYTEEVNTDEIYQMVKIRLLNNEMNLLYCKDKLTFPVSSDLIGCYQYGQGDDSVVITKNMVDAYDLDLTTLHEAALKNTKRESCLYYLHDYMEIMRGNFVPMQDQRQEIVEQIKSNSLTEPVVLTNQDLLYGAGQLLALDDIFADTSMTLYIQPTSVHELVIYPQSLNITPKELEQDLLQNNAYIPDDILSDRIYQYTPYTKHLKIIADRYGIVPECPDTVVSRETRGLHYVR